MRDSEVQFVDDALKALVRRRRWFACRKGVLAVVMFDSSVVLVLEDRLTGSFDTE